MKMIVILLSVVCSLFMILVDKSFSNETKFVFTGKEIVLSTDFDNGWMARIEEKEKNVFEVWPYDYKHYKWDWVYLESMTRESRYDHTGFCFHFRISGCKDKKITFRFHVKEHTRDENAITVLYANPDFPVLSYDEENWWRTDNKSMEIDTADSTWSIVTVEQFFEEDLAYCAFQYPYSGSHLDRLIERIRYSPFCTIETVGNSTEGREIKQISITNRDITSDKKLTAWFLGLQHSSELAAGYGLEGMIEFLLTDDPLAEKARDDYVFKIIPIVNIDAVNEGKGRSHSTGNNLNRLWELDSSIPGIDSIIRTLDEWIEQGNTIDLFFDIHGFSSKNGEWTLLMPEEAYSSEMSGSYKMFVNIMLKILPKAKPGLKSIPGLSCNTGLRKYGAVSMCIDGYIYDWKVSKYTNLSSHYILGEKIWPFEEIKAAGIAYVDALVEYAELFGKAGITTPKRLTIDLYPNYPNPFNNQTTISFRIPESMPVTIRIYNSAGQWIRTLVDDYVSSGKHYVSWDGRDNMGRKMDSGVFIVRIHAGSSKMSKKIILLK